MNSDLAFTNWTLQLIRKDGIALGWLEEKRFDWCAIAYQFIDNIINGYTIVLCTDTKRQWFCEYILQAINTNTGRPLIPIFNIYHMLPKCNDMNVELVEDMLEVAFGDKYAIWYVGHINHILYRLAMDSKNNFIWTFDSSLNKAFNIGSQESDCDIRLLQLFKVLNTTIDAMMFNEIE